MNAKNIGWIIGGAVCAGASVYLWVVGCFYCLSADHLRNIIFLAAGITAAIIAFWRAQVSDNEAETNKQRHITDRYIRAEDQLNSEGVDVRINAIKSLEKVGIESEDKVLDILRLLSYHVRKTSPVGGEIGSGYTDRRDDASVGVSVIGRLAGMYKHVLKKEHESVDLSLVFAYYLHRLPDLTQCYFAGFNLNCSNFSRAIFDGCDLTEASFCLADLRGSTFSNCVLVNAYFEGANLDYAKFCGDVTEVKLAGAYCNGTDFSGAKNLTREMLKSIRFSEENSPTLPDYLSQEDLPPPRNKEESAYVMDIISDFAKVARPAS